MAARVYSSRMKILLPFAFLAPLTSLATAAVTLTFDTELEGFESQENATSLEHSSVNGGSMKLTAAGGWAGNSSTYNLRSNADVWAETQKAAANGGILGFDVTVVGSEQTLTANPGWFELVVIANSTGADNGGTGGWDQNVISLGITSDQWPLDPDNRTINVSLPIRSSAAIEDDGELWWDTIGEGWSELRFGLNNDGAAVSQAAVYFDNVSISANAVPEPTSGALIALGGLLLLGRRSRR